MSANMLNCRGCGRHMVRTHHGGRVDFLAEVVEDPPGLFKLTCVCGEVRNWTATKGAP